MASCVVISGESNSGKTYLARAIGDAFKGKAHSFDKVISFDFVMSAVCEDIRHHFENGTYDALEIKWHSVVFESEKDFDDFNKAFTAILSSSTDLCQKVYTRLIKEKRPASSFRPGVDKPRDIVNLGVLGRELDAVGAEIVELTFRHVLKQAARFIMEGIYFSKGTNYVAQLEKRCSKVVYLETIFERAYQSHTYTYKGEKIGSIRDITDRLSVDLFLAKAEPGMQSKNVSGPKMGIRKYQMFEEGQVGDSPSFQKIKLLQIPADLKGKVVLDLGCNEGYYCFECEKRGGHSVGIEFNKTWYDLALKRKEEFSSKAEFLLMDWNKLQTLERKFDLVLFLAAFHYLKDNQLEMLKKIFGRMNPGGVLILEVGLSSRNEGRFFIEMITRSAGDRCQYPNKFSIEKLLRESGFEEVIFQGEGFNIKGDPVPRYIVHARK